MVDMAKQTQGIHHITAIVGNPQENVDFYAGILGLRLVKKTINFDDPGTYHLYFGNEEGEPGTIITFFTWKDAPQGEIGGGQVGVIQFVVPAGSFEFWKKRLTKMDISFTETSRFGESYLVFRDPHGLQLELVERVAGRPSEWSFGGIGKEEAIKGFGGATLLSTQPESTSTLLEKIMGLELVGEEKGLRRFAAPANLGNQIDLQLERQPVGRFSVGTVHHIAWRAQDDADQLDWQKWVAEHGYSVTEVKDRNYFKAIYFREHGGILFEVATDPPGFAIDEPKDQLGQRLMLPEWYESERQKFEETLLPIVVREPKEV